MSGSIEVDPGRLGAMAGRVLDVGADLDGVRASGVGGPARPPLTAAALHRLEGTLRGSLGAVADAVDDLGRALRAAAIAYAAADDAAVPGGGR